MDLTQEHGEGRAGPAVLTRLAGVGQRDVGIPWTDVGLAGEHADPRGGIHQIRGAHGCPRLRRRHRERRGPNLRGRSGGGCRGGRLRCPTQVLRIVPQPRHEARERRSAHVVDVLRHVPLTRRGEPADEVPLEPSTGRGVRHDRRRLFHLPLHWGRVVGGRGRRGLGGAVGELGQEGHCLRAGLRNLPPRVPREPLVENLDLRHRGRDGLHNRCERPHQIQGPCADEGRLVGPTLPRSASDRERGGVRRHVRHPVQVRLRQALAGLHSDRHVGKQGVHRRPRRLPQTRDGPADRPARAFDLCGQGAEPLLRIHEGHDALGQGTGEAHTRAYGEVGKHQPVRRTGDSHVEQPIPLHPLRREPVVDVDGGHGHHRVDLRPLQPLRGPNRGAGHTVLAHQLHFGKPCRGTSGILGHVAGHVLFEDRGLRAGQRVGAEPLHAAQLARHGEHQLWRPGDGSLLIGVLLRRFGCLDARSLGRLRKDARGDAVLVPRRNALVNLRPEDVRATHGGCDGVLPNLATCLGRGSLLHSLDPLPGSGLLGRVARPLHGLRRLGVDQEGDGAQHRLPPQRLVGPLDDLHAHDPVLEAHVLRLPGPDAPEHAPRRVQDVRPGASEVILQKLLGDHAQLRQEHRAGCVAHGHVRPCADRDPAHRGAGVLGVPHPHAAAEAHVGDAEAVQAGLGVVRGGVAHGQHRELTRGRASLDPGLDVLRDLRERVLRSLPVQHLDLARLLAHGLGRDPHGPGMALSDQVAGLHDPASRTVVAGEVGDPGPLCRGQLLERVRGGPAEPVDGLLGIADQDRTASPTNGRVDAGPREQHVVVLRLVHDDELAGTLPVPGVGVQHVQGLPGAQALLGQLEVADGLDDHAVLFLVRERRHDLRHQRQGPLNGPWTRVDAVEPQPVVEQAGPDGRDVLRGLVRIVIVVVRALDRLHPLEPGQPGDGPLVGPPGRRGRDDVEHEPQHLREHVGAGLVPLLLELGPLRPHELAERGVAPHLPRDELVERQDALSLHGLTSVRAEHPKQSMGQLRRSGVREREDRDVPGLVAMIVDRAGRDDDHGLGLARPRTRGHDQRHRARLQ